VCLAIERTDIDYPEWASGHAIAAAIADVLLHDDGVKFGFEQSASRTGFHAGRIMTVLADIAHHQPIALKCLHFGWPIRKLFYECNVAPGVGGKSTGVIIALAGEAEMVGRQIVPLLTGDFAGFAADANGCVGKEAV
jgi:hypothetical protein